MNFMDAALNFNIWILSFITEADKVWLQSTDYIYRRETGARYMGHECWIIFPQEKYLGFLLLKFGDRMKPFPLEQHNVFTSHRN
jgi:hypothetical protein